MQLLQFLDIMRALTSILKLKQTKLLKNIVKPRLTFRLSSIEGKA